MPPPLKKPKPLKLPKVKIKKYDESSSGYQYVVVINPWTKPTQNFDRHRNELDSEVQKQQFGNKIGVWFERMTGKKMKAVYFEPHKDCAIVELGNDVNVDNILGAHHTKDFFEDPTSQENTVSEIYRYNYESMGDPDTKRKLPSVYPTYGSTDLSKLRIKDDYPPPGKLSGYIPYELDHYVKKLSTETKEMIASRRAKYEQSLAPNRNSSSGSGPGPSFSESSLSSSNSRPSMSTSTPPPIAGPSNSNANSIRELDTHTSTDTRESESNAQGYVPYTPNPTLAAMRARHGQNQNETKPVLDMSGERRYGEERSRPENPREERPRAVTEPMNRAEERIARWRKEKEQRQLKKREGDLQSYSSSHSNSLSDSRTQHESSSNRQSPSFSRDSYPSRSYDGDSTFDRDSSYGVDVKPRLSELDSRARSRSNTLATPLGDERDYHQSVNIKPDPYEKEENHRRSLAHLRARTSIETGVETEADATRKQNQITSGSGVKQGAEPVTVKREVDLDLSLQSNRAIRRQGPSESTGILSDVKLLKVKKEESVDPSLSLLPAELYRTWHAVYAEESHNENGNVGTGITNAASDTGRMGTSNLNGANRGIGWDPTSLSPEVDEVKAKVKVKEEFLDPLSRPVPPELKHGWKQVYADGKLDENANANANAGVADAGTSRVGTASGMGGMGPRAGADSDRLGSLLGEGVSGTAFVKDEPESNVSLSSNRTNVSTKREHDEDDSKRDQFEGSFLIPRTLGGDRKRMKTEGV